ncbi:phosphotransferase enzyme family protein [Streptomyces sp. NPDC088354]|uniref:phosphotransferase enzyme family protein n=1 Tax=unclassified Streptomyces TaxID=2593676 RepID=UPI0029A562AC|nr:phosphotransferase [Streptomyces sp. MI02-7b]MDX3072574.1 phosphotransferase [Streptomyces sp. MI02-7b]
MRDRLRAWGGIQVVGPLSGGHRNEVLEVRRGRRRWVARRSRRRSAALEWELDLLEYLGAHGFTVPGVVPAADGRRHIDGLVVQTWVEGEPPAPRDWPAVAAELRRLHTLTENWSQRPGFCSATDLLRRERGGDIDLSVMPEGAVAACREAWRQLEGTPRAVVHGDPAAANIRVTGGGVGFLDWDEARVDHVDLDLADLPVDALPPRRLAPARAAVHAWEAANGWLVEPSYARRRLAQLVATGRGEETHGPGAEDPTPDV